VPSPLLYCRVSTQEQASEGYSLEAQLRQLEVFCASQGWEPVARYVEEGYSGKNLDRPQLKALLADVRARRFPEPCVLVWRLDRLTRSVADLYRLLSIFERYGCTFRSVTEPFETQTAVGKLFVTLIAAMAQWERENLVERVRLGQVHQVTQTEDWPGGRPPYGYHLQNRRLVVDTQAAAVVREVYQRFLKTPNLYRIAKDLNARGTRAPGGGQWTAHRLRYILSNPIYAGIRAWQRHARKEERGGYRRQPRDKWLVVEDKGPPPIVDRDTWERAFGILEQNARVSPRWSRGEHPLTGTLVCGACGSTMNGRQIRRRGRVYRYYRCPGHYQRRTCALGEVRAEEIESLVRTAIRARFKEQVLLREALLEALGKGDEGARLGAQIQELRRRMRRWEDAYEEGEIDVHTLGERLRELRALEEQVRARLRRQAPGWPSEDAPHPGDGWQAMTAAERRAFLRELVVRVVVHLDGAVDIAWRER
jgi:site-specific DNA recombinase